MEIYFLILSVVITLSLHIIYPTLKMAICIDICEIYYKAVVKIFLSECITTITYYHFLVQIQRDTPAQIYHMYACVYICVCI